MNSPNDPWSCGNGDLACYAIAARHFIHRGSWNAALGSIREALALTPTRKVESRLLALRAAIYLATEHPNLAVTDAKESVGIDFRSELAHEVLTAALRAGREEL